MTKIINGVASEYDIPMKYENKTMTIEVKNDEMLGRTTNSTLHIELIKLQQENKQLKDTNVKLISENNKLQHRCYSSIEYIDQILMYKPCAREIDKELDNLIGILRGKYDE